MERLDGFSGYLRLEWCFTKVLILLELFLQLSYYNETQAVRFSNKQRNCDFKEQLDRDDPVPESQSINLYSGHQVFLRFEPT